eukprot:Tbor_TRINITY_DN4539_c0_g1::TRINITY_DN4539_c0_g1_i1::g.15796::m.15796
MNSQGDMLVQQVGDRKVHTQYTEESPSTLIPTSVYDSSKYTRHAVDNTDNTDGIKRSTQSGKASSLSSLRLKYNKFSKSVPTVGIAASSILVPPSSGRMYPIVGNTHQCRSSKSSPLAKMDAENSRIISQRKEDDVRMNVLADQRRRNHSQMCRERQRMVLGQRTVYRETLQAKSGQGEGDTPNDNVDRCMTESAKHREDLSKVPRRWYVETNRDRMEINLIRREEERSKIRQLQVKRRALEQGLGVSYAKSQVKLFNKMTLQRGTSPVMSLHSTCDTNNTNTFLGTATYDIIGGLPPTPEEALRAELLRRSDEYYKAEEAVMAKQAMDCLAETDERLWQREKIIRRERQERKQKLRDESKRQKGQ